MANHLALHEYTDYEGTLNSIEDLSLNWDQPPVVHQRSASNPSQQHTSGLSALPGPHWMRDRFPNKRSFLLRLHEARIGGRFTIFAEELAKELAGDSAVNMVFPIPVPSLKRPHITDLVMLCHPNDAARIARLHNLKAQFHIAPFFKGDSIVATRNKALWLEQRQALVEGLLPLSSLAKVMPISVQRAEFASRALMQKHAADKNQPIDMLSFFSHETAAQLHLVMLGETTDFSEANNDEVRAAFEIILCGRAAVGMAAYNAAIQRVQRFSATLLQRAVDQRGNPNYTGPFRASSVGCPVAGPLGAKLAENRPVNTPNPISVQRDTMTTIAFAGFDTTANLLSWVTFELCRHPELQRRLQEEIDLVFASLPDGCDLEYSDMGKFTYMTRVINEALRLWAPAGSGTYRELLYDEEVEGAPGRSEKVKLPKGTQVWIPNLLLHRSEALWGKDVLEFNPDRAWLPEETWFGRDFAAFSTASHRFAPFSFPPRGCLGMNFSQFEARVVLATLLRDFDFELAEPTKSMAPGAETIERFLAFDRATMAPRGGMFATVKPRARRTGRGKL